MTRQNNQINVKLARVHKSRPNVDQIAKTKCKKANKATVHLGMIEN